MPSVGGYEAPLRHLPPLHRPPIDKPLPFGPRNAVLLQEGASQAGRIIVGGGRWRFAVQRFDGHDWVPAPGNPPPEKHKAIIQRLPPGQRDECVHFRVPTDEDPGPYRFVMVVERSPERTKNRTVQVTAEFEISGRSQK